MTYDELFVAHTQLVYCYESLMSNPMIWVVLV